MSSNNVLKNFSYLSIVQILNYALPLITIPLVSRVLGVEKIGLVSYIFSYITYFILLVNYSFSLTAIRKQAQINNLNYTFSLVFKSQLILLVLATLIFISTIFIIKDLAENFILAILSYLAVIGAFFDKNWTYQYKQDLSLVAIVNAILKVIGVFLIIFFIKKQSDYLLYALILYGITALTNIILFGLSIKKYKIKFVSTSFVQIYSFVKEGRMLFFSSVVISFYTSTSTLLLGLYCNVKDVGLYVSAMKVVDISKVFAILPITQIIYPIVAKKITFSEENGVTFVKKLMPVFNLMALIMLLGALIFGPIVLHILFGKEFSDAVPILWILSFTLVMILYSTIFGIVLMVNLGMDHLFFKNQLYVAILSILLTILILPFGAGMTSAMILVLSEMLITGYQYHCLRSKGYNMFTLDMFTKKSFIDAIKALKSH